jgi:hypothetical protein
MLVCTVKAFLFTHTVGIALALALQQCQCNANPSFKSFTILQYVVLKPAQASLVNDYFQHILGNTKIRTKFLQFFLCCLAQLEEINLNKYL